MRVHRISAITLKVNEMESSCRFYSKIPGFRVVYGGAPDDTFSTFEISEGERKAYLNLELAEEMTERKVGIMMTQADLEQEKEEEREQGTGSSDSRRTDFGRIIFHTENVDDLYRYMKKEDFLSKHAIFETEPAEAPWGERFFHIRDPDGYQLSFAQPLKR